MKNTESREMYILSIYKVRKKLGKVREVDVAEDRKVSTPSAHKALKNLESLGLINFVPGDLTLTDDGEKIAENIFEKHILIKKALLVLGVSPQSAEENASRIEHVLSDDVFERIKIHIDVGEKKLMQKMMSLHSMLNFKD